MIACEVKATRCSARIMWGSRDDVVMIWKKCGLLRHRSSLVTLHSLGDHIIILLNHGTASDNSLSLVHIPPFYLTYTKQQTKLTKMALRLGDTAPDFEVSSTLAE